MNTGISAPLKKLFSSFIKKQRRLTMSYTLSAACICHTGRVRKNNEDNFFFYGRHLEAENEGFPTPVSIEEPLRYGTCLAVFDGMGGENYGEDASYAAAHTLQQTERSLSDYLIQPRKYLTRLALRINDAVVAAQRNKGTSRMGSTMVSLYFTASYAYVCNLGDSRAYRLRDGEFGMISHDHVDPRPLKPGHKAPLTQHLGIDPEEMLIEPYVAKGKLKKGDQYLLCSDGLTDMLSNFEIADILLRESDTEKCVKLLVDTALEHGGRDNVTVILCRIR